MLIYPPTHFLVARCPGEGLNLVVVVVLLRLLVALVRDVVDDGGHEGRHRPRRAEAPQRLRERAQAVGGGGRGGRVRGVPAVLQYYFHTLLRFFGINIFRISIPKCRTEGRHYLCTMICLAPVGGVEGEDGAVRGGGGDGVGLGQVQVVVGGVW